MALGETVYDRAKKTGFLMGPRHQYGAAMDEAAPETEEDNGGQKPPNLRDAGGDPSTCDNCVHSEGGEDGNLQCSKYGGYPVLPSQVCDDYEAETGPEEGEGAEEGGALPGSFLEAARARLGGGR